MQLTSRKKANYEYRRDDYWLYRWDWWYGNGQTLPSQSYAINNSSVTRMQYYSWLVVSRLKTELSGCSRSMLSDILQKWADAILLPEQSDQLSYLIWSIYMRNLLDCSHNRSDSQTLSPFVSLCSQSSW